MEITTIALILIVLCIIYSIGVYNKLVSLRHSIHNAWGQIDIQLKRRYDLIPNLVETVKTFMKHEKETLHNVIEARNRAVSASGVHEKAEAEQQVAGSLANFFAVAESYPELRSNQNMLSLQEELKSTENKISFARQYYNDTVTLFNVKIRSFPDMIVAQAGNFKPEELFDIEEPQARKNVKLDFD